jgi:UDP-N-acetyl-D-galactosamine dehydrogenase
MNIKPCVIGLGYVGLPVFLRVQSKFQTIGYDINKIRIKTLNKKIDTNKEFNEFELKLKNKSKFVFKSNLLEKCNFYIVTMPTPLTYQNKPDMSFLEQVSILLSKILKKNDIIIFESTVYPGASKYLTKNYLEKGSGLKENKDFFVGYSPERINPGDRVHTIQNTKKILAIQTRNQIIKKKIISIYKTITKKIILSNKVEEAEMAKLIENIQRDLEIAFINDIYIFCRKMDYNFKKIIDLASTKWNFKKFAAGLVGGHCLPVDPYYLIYVAKKKKINLNTILAGRKTNNHISKLIENEIKNILKKNIYKKIYLMGITYKKNVSDIRNSLALKIFIKLRNTNKNVFAIDPICENSVQKKFKILKDVKKFEKNSLYVFLVNHKQNQNYIKEIKQKKIPYLDPFYYY